VCTSRASPICAPEACLSSVEGGRDDETTGNSAHTTAIMATIAATICPERRPPRFGASAFRRARLPERTPPSDSASPRSCPGFSVDFEHEERPRDAATMKR